MRLRHRIAGIAMAGAVASGLLVAGGTAAEAGAYGCSGKFIRSWPISAKFVVVSDVRLYYNSSTRYSCAVNVKRKAYRGKKTQTDIEMLNQTWAEDNQHKGVNWDKDGGKFSQYAGPVKVRGRSTKGKKYKVTIVASASGGSGVNTPPVWKTVWAY